MTIIFLNGPPGCGKDTAANFILDAMSNCRHRKISQPLKDICKIMMPLGEAYWKIAFDEKADEIMDKIADTTPRQLQIDIWKFMVERFGTDIMGQLFAMQMTDVPAKHVVVSDGGMEDEVRAITRVYPACRAIRIHREGHDFSNDSRSYIDYERFNIKTVDLDNDHDLDMYRAQINRVLVKWQMIEKKCVLQRKKG